MGLFNRHDAKNSSLVAVVLDKQSISPGNMEPVTTTIQLFKIAIRWPLPFETGNMVTDNAAILFGENPDEVNDLLFYQQHFQRPSFLAASFQGMEGSAAATSRSWERRRLCSVEIKDTNSSSKVSPGLRRFDNASQVLGLTATRLVAICS